MGLIARIRRRFSPPQPPPAPSPIVDPNALQALADRVERLEAMQLDRELQWTETKDKLLRYLKRVQELDRRAADPATADRANQLANVISAKFPRAAGG